jgi:hypothetical protein
LFDTLAVLRPDWLSSIYLYLSKKEAYRDAEKAFCGILRSLPFATPPEIALGKSCLGARDIAALEQRARQGFSGAVEALAAIQRFVGASPFPVAMSPDSQPSNCTVPLPSLAAPSPMDYAPDRIAAYWNELRANYCGRGEEELRAWADYWRTRESTRVVCDALMRLRESEERSGCSLLIYELVAETQGRDTAYPWLVQAFRETHGWYAHYSSPVTASKMWSVVRGCHPAKRLSFIAETMGAHGPTEPSLHGRFGRLIEYLQLIGRDSDAERVLQGVCDSIQGLVAPYRLPRLDNLTEAASTPVPVLAILLARLTWPSGMVRERSCTALTDLITDPNEQPQTADAILHWIHNQRLESVACLGLLPFVKMKQFRRDAVLPAIGQFRAACARPSIQYECLLGYLFPGEESALSLGHGHSGAIPPDFLPDGIFSEQHARMSRTCSDGVTLLGRAFNVSLLQRWAYETHQASVRGLSEDANASYYWGRRDDEHYVAFDTILSETFRSGYLRTLAWLAETHEGSRASCRTEAIRSLPLDLGLWFADPQPMPKWWPIIATHANDMIDTVPAEVANSVESLWALREADDWVIGMASGRVSEGSATYDLEIFGLFQSCTGPQTPTAESLFETAPWGKGGLRLMPVSAEYQGVVRESSPDDLAVHMDDWQIVPGVRFAPPWPVPRWQWWRAIRSMWAPLPLLSVEGKLNVTCGADRVEFWDGEEPLGIWRDWSLGLSEQQTANLTPRTGQALMLRRSAVDRFAASKGYTFCWAYRVNGFQRKRIGQYDEFGISYVIGATNLILPT